MNWPLNFKVGKICDPNGAIDELTDQCMINAGFDLRPDKPLDWVTVDQCLSMGYTSPISIYDINTLVVCPNSHITETALFTQSPSHWCPHEDCDGLDEAFCKVLKNLNATYRNATNIFNPYWPDQIEVKCSNPHPHKWISEKQTILRGVWCDICTRKYYVRGDIREMLAKRIGGRYCKRKKIFYCYKEEPLTADVLDMIRGLKCSDHEECISMRTMISDLETGDRDKYLLRQLNLLANLKGGCCLSESSSKVEDIEWICYSNSHQDAFTWKSSIRTFLSGSWCPKCADVEENPPHRKSKGHEAVKRWLTEMNIEFYEEYPMPGCRDKGQLRCDFYLSYYNVVIEFDGSQHFEPVEFWGGVEKYRQDNRRDHIKSWYCFVNEIRLYRFYNLSTLEAELESAFDTLPRIVGAIPIDPQYADESHSFIRQTPKQRYQWFTF